MSGFQDHLNECLTALLNGERSIEECLALYPKEAQRLEPLLRTGLALRGALWVEPPAAFVEAAKERLSAASRQSLVDALNAGPRPSFARTARQRFLAAAQRMFGAQRRWQFPVPAPSLRALTVSVSAVVLIFFSLGALAVTTSDSALPGDWRYPVKRASEDLRMTLTFSSEGRRDLRLNLAGERLSEIERLADKGRAIGGGLLSDLKGETASLVDNLQASGVKSEKARDIAVLAQRQKEVLASVEPLVAPEDKEKLQAAAETSEAAYVKAAQTMALALFAEKSGRAGREEPIKESELRRAQEGTAVPVVPAAAAETPGQEPTAAPSPEPPAATPQAPLAIIEHGVDEGSTVLMWDRVAIGRFSVEVPGQGSGWRFVGFDFSTDNTAPAPNILRIANTDGTAVIVINPRSGDAFWYQFKDGLFDEFIVRVAVGDDVWQATPEALLAFHAGNGPLVLHIINSIEIAPPPTATPTSTATVAPKETATVAAAGSSPTPAPSR